MKSHQIQGRTRCCHLVLVIVFPSLSLTEWLGKQGREVIPELGKLVQEKSTFCVYRWIFSASPQQLIYFCSLWQLPLLGLCCCLHVIASALLFCLSLNVDAVGSWLHCWGCQKILEIGEGSFVSNLLYQRK